MACHCVSWPSFVYHGLKFHKVTSLRCQYSKETAINGDKTTYATGIQAILFTKNTTLFTKAPFFSQKYHSFHKLHFEKARTCSNFPERYRIVCVPYVSMVPKNYDYRRLKA